MCAWCFVDHLGPAAVTEQRGLDVAPHPHIGLQTVTWLFAGEALHRDSLGTEQIISPGQLNLMTAGDGVAHSEESTGRYRGDLHGIQLWVAQPSTTRHDAPAFEHHARLAELELGDSIATVLVGELLGSTSPARRDSDHVGIHFDLSGGTTIVPLRADFEYALVVCNGAVHLDGHVVEPGHLAYLGLGRDECRLSTDEPAVGVLLGGVPFDEPLLMWWNFVARTEDEITAAHQEWATAGTRFGRVASPLPRVEIDSPPWTKREGTRE